MWAVFVLYHHIFADIDERAAVVALLRGTLFQKDERWRESEIPARRLSLPHPHVSHNNNRPMTHSWEFLAWWILLLYPWLSVSSGSSWQVKAMNESPSLNYFHNKQPLKRGRCFVLWVCTLVCHIHRGFFSCSLCTDNVHPDPLQPAQHNQPDVQLLQSMGGNTLSKYHPIHLHTVFFLSFQLGARWLPYYS